MNVLIGTKNQGKVQGAKNALEHYFQDVEMMGVSVDSDVADQPIDAETFYGARNRVVNLKKYAENNNVSADLYMAIESGMVNLFGHWVIMNIAIVEDNDGFQSVGVSPCFPVPEKYVEDIKKIGLGEVMNNIFSKDDERHNRGGGIQLLTHDVISRIDINEDAFVMALTRYINKDFWN